jgi:hypothetical protein
MADDDEFGQSGCGLRTKALVSVLILFTVGVTSPVFAQNANVEPRASSAPAPQAIAPSSGCHDEQGRPYL